jgi:hypothetical protein
MSRLVIGGCAAACLVIGLYVRLYVPTAQEPGSQPVPPSLPSLPALPSLAVATAVDTPPTPTPTPAAPKPPALLPEVIDVTDIEHLLDPSPRPDSAVPFDPDPAVAPAVPVFPAAIPAVAPAVAAVAPAVVATPDRIPPAVD